MFLITSIKSNSYEERNFSISQQTVRYKQDILGEIPVSQSMKYLSTEKDN